MNLNRGKTSSYHCNLTSLKGYKNNNGNENSEQNDNVHCHSRVREDWKIRIWVKEKYRENSSHEHYSLKVTEKEETKRREKNSRLYLVVCKEREKAIR